MSRGPLPSQLCLLSQLPAYAVHDKVRFLGCVLAYSTRGAILQLAHAYPRGTNVTAHVDVSLVLETLGEEQTRVGEWVNVIGYITAKADTASAPTAPSTATQAASVHIQALVLWSTGPLNVDRYEMSFEKKTNKE
ncbi:unnamed protein product [Clonostachys rosea f. rosea IK726]|uniref:Uncharacterized protein n=1 Tax=Clonostachys rosea f. rosea IK726 TaxID=1349383 RepID=A0ACA9TRD0_BIOOC|nr:unnamed protein product [Clonostachys rosea f. rosea IK726]